MRILIVDDSQVVRRTLRVTLERHDDWQVCGEAADGREGIEQAQKLVPDLVVLDFSMPVMNGVEATRELTRLLPSLPILMFTNYGIDYLHQEALSAGARAVLSKSDSVQSLLSTIQSVIKPIATA